MCLNLAFIPLVYFVYPETANLTLEEMDYLFISDEAGEGNKGVMKSWGRSEDVMRSLERERLGEYRAFTCSRRCLHQNAALGGCQACGGVFGF